MSTLIEQARQATENRKLADEEDKVREAARQRELQEQQTRDITQWAITEMTTLRADILKTAEKGSNAHSYTVSLFEDKVSDRTYEKARVLTGLLEAEGFGVSRIIDADEPVGSDPMFYHTVYTTRLLISW